MGGAHFKRKGVRFYMKEINSIYCFYFLLYNKIIYTWSDSEKLRIKHVVL
jgi:hypothetical protein